MAVEFQLLETMRSERDREGKGTVRLLDRHLARVAGTARVYGFTLDAARVRQAVETAAVEAPENLLRLLVARDGGTEVQRKPLPTSRYTQVALAARRVNSAERLLRHKTTARQVYEEARAGFDASTDAVLRNERGEFTETTIANIAVLRSGVWTTPPVDCGLLPGVMRAELLAQSEWIEGVVTRIEAGEVVRCANALRGVYEVVFGGPLG
jgi:branched-subunit amino acid aminotransferase/4-amino-4-deoxychorismate lyase